MAVGICDNLLLAVYLSAKTPVVIAPAMDLGMYKHPTMKENIKKLESFGNFIIPPGTGELASGMEGEGRMAEPQEIVRFLSELVKKKSPLSGKKALVTAGPTYEAIDPVRFIGNHSSGKMGIAIAEELAKNGADVILICGPTQKEVNHPAVRRIDVTSAEEMHRACMKHSKYADVIVMAAAVADFRAKVKAREKIKKEEGKFRYIELVPTKDILADISKHKNRILLVGFALETENGIANAKKKLYNKNLDIIVLNTPSAKTGFRHNTNRITIIAKQNGKERLKKFGLMSKEECAKVIVKEIINKMA
jgi:phosphopantothenoylcysteine decarboxylase/phosphopantothenate--cysteine ligase